MANFIEIKCKSACNKLDGYLPYTWDLNAYRGCQHGCEYCFAMYSHDYLNSEGYFDNIYVKTNIVERLEKQLAAKSWTGEVINLGGVTDSYQPAEKHFKLMPDILRVLIKYKNPAIISTKSALLLRDFDLWEKLGSLTYVNVASTITCADDALRAKIEPNASSTPARFEMLKAFSQTQVSTGMHIMPVMPYITDTYENIDGLYAAAKEAGVKYSIYCSLNLRSQTRKNFFTFAQEHFPGAYFRLKKLYRTAYAPEGYDAQLERMFSALSQKYYLPFHYKNPNKDKVKPKEQMLLFK